jgi:RNA polymerase sigma-70 factor, ECF subfamily
MILSVPTGTGHPGELLPLARASQSVPPALNSLCLTVIIAGLSRLYHMKEQLRRRNLLSVLEEPAIAIPDELDQAFRAHHSLVFRTAYRITGNAGDAEDVLQTVFLRMLRRGRNADPLENAESYLRRAAINAALDVIRSRQANPTVALPEEKSGLMPSAPAAVDISGLRQALSRAMAELKPMQAEIFALRFLEGHGNRQIAQALGISQVRVAVILHRTRLQLRQQLRPYLRS